MALLIGLAIAGIALCVIAALLMFATLKRGIREEIRGWKLRRWRPAPVVHTYRVVRADRSNQE